MTLLIIAGYVPLVIAFFAVSIYLSTRGNHSDAARELGDRVGRRSGLDRRQQRLDFVGNDRRSGAERRVAEAARDERAA